MSRASDTTIEMLAEFVVDDPIDSDGAMPGTHLRKVECTMEGGMTMTTPDGAAAKAMAEANGRAFA